MTDGRPDDEASAMIRSVLFLCTGNSCRSQMAEGIVNHDLGAAWRAASAGTHPSEVNPRAVAVMREIGIDISAHRSKHVEDLRGRRFDLVITVCANAERTCPVWIGPETRVHIGFDDPADAVGTEEQILAVFRRVRDEIREKVVGYLRGLDESVRS